MLLTTSRKQTKRWRTPNELVTSHKTTSIQIYQEQELRYTKKRVEAAGNERIEEASSISRLQRVGNEEVRRQMRISKSEGHKLYIISNYVLMKLTISLINAESRGIGLLI